MLHLWLGPEIYGPFLERFTRGEVTAELAAPSTNAQPAPEA